MKILLLSVLSVALIASCSKNSVDTEPTPVPDPIDPVKAISFVFGIDTVTTGYANRASMDAEVANKIVFSDGDKVGMWMQHTPTNSTSKASYIPSISSVSYGNLCYYTTGGSQAIFTPSLAENNNNASIAFSWVSTARSVGSPNRFNFVAYYPYTGPLQSFADDGGVTTKSAGGFDWTSIPISLEVDQTSADGLKFPNLRKSDVLYSKLDNGTSINISTPSDSKVKLVFNHAFAMTEFHVSKDPSFSDDVMILKEVQISGAKIRPTAVISYPSSINAVQASSVSQATIRHYGSNTIIKGSPAGNSILEVATTNYSPVVVRVVTPVSNSDSGDPMDYLTNDYKFNFVVDRSGTVRSYKYDLIGGSGKKVESGKKYVYRATITETGASIWGTTIEDWDDYGNVYDIIASI